MDKKEELKAPKLYWRRLEPTTLSSDGYTSTKLTNDLYLLAQSYLHDNIESSEIADNILNLRYDNVNNFIKKLCSPNAWKNRTAKLPLTLIDLMKLSHVRIPAPGCAFLYEICNKAIGDALDSSAKLSLSISVRSSLLSKEIIRMYDLMEENYYSLSKETFDHFKVDQYMGFLFGMMTEIRNLGYIPFRTMVHSCHTAHQRYDEESQYLECISNHLRYNALEVWENNPVLFHSEIANILEPLFSEEMPWCHRYENNTKRRERTLKFIRSSLIDIAQTLGRVRGQDKRSSQILNLDSFKKKINKIRRSLPLREFCCKPLPKSLAEQFGYIDVD